MSYHSYMYVYAPADPIIRSLGPTTTIHSSLFTASRVDLSEKVLSGLIITSHISLLLYSDFVLCTAPRQD